MIQTLKLMRLNSQIKRFCDVFVDIIDTEDCTFFLSEALKINPKMKFQGINNCTSPDELFYVIYMSIQTELGRKNPRAIFKDRGAFLLESFFMFCNDAFLWGDLSDLYRWSESLFDALHGYNQKNFKPLSLVEDELSRELLFLQYCNYIASELGETVLKFAVESVSDWKESEGVQE